MGLPYYPGCTLSTKAANYDRSGRAVAEALGLPLEELPDWQCCGATFPLAVDDSMALIAPTRVLYQAQCAGERLVTLCAICFHVLRRSQALLSRDPAMLERINWFTEQEYRGGVHVVHFLEVLRDDVGWDALVRRVVRPLTGLRVAPYYGCLLLRPHDEIGLDDPEHPTILHDLLRALGAEPVDFPFSIECCGSYLTVKDPDISQTLSRDIVASARSHGAQAIAAACPLCQFNLDYAQRPGEAGSTRRELPVVYFTQLMAAALGLPEATWGIENHYVTPAGLLAQAEEPAHSLER
ncbi:MAG: disulfide reductase [Anaerolineales bacterium]|nr:disulfide reductase [Anaerolineales bacterium]